MEKIVVSPEKGGKMAEWGIIVLLMFYFFKNDDGKN